MRPEAVIFDMDDVLCRYDLGKRLRALSRITGQTPRDIRAAIWDSGFEDEADSGGYPDPETYLAEFGQPHRPSHRPGAAGWRPAASAMQPWPDMLTSRARSANSRGSPSTTNNGPLTKAALPELFPEAAEIFPEHYHSFEFGDQEARSPELHPS